MMKSWKIIIDAWTGSLLEFVVGIIITALFILAIIIIFAFGGML